MYDCLPEPDRPQPGGPWSVGRLAMSDKLAFIRFPIVLIVIFFIGRLAMGAAGASYEAGNRVFSMVILETHLALIWGAVARRYGRYGIGGALQIGLLIGVATQILIFGATLASDLTGIQTYFNNPVAVSGASPEALTFGETLLLRTGGFVGNSIFSAILAAVGWAMGTLIPERKTV
jgi:hypothetical protein